MIEWAKVQIGFEGTKSGMYLPAQNKTIFSIGWRYGFYWFFGINP
jgi:hypothetical protein